MDYGDIFKRGFLHTWNNKFLYILGFLAALGGSAGASASVNIQFPGGFGPTPSPQGIEELEKFFESFEANILNFIEIIGAFIAIVILISCVLTAIRLVMWFVRLIAEASMIQAVADLETDVETNFRKAFADGRSFMLNIFMTRLVLFIFPFIAIFLMLIAVAFTTVPFIDSSDPQNFEAIIGSIGLVFVPIMCLICLSVPYSLFVSTIYPIAQRGIVFKGMHVVEAIKYGWKVLKENPAEIVLFAFLYFVLGIIVGIVNAVVSTPIMIGASWPVLSSLFFKGEMPGSGAFVLLGTGIIVATVINALINSVFITFRSSSFTLAYLQLEGKSIEAA